MFDGTVLLASSTLLGAIWRTAAARRSLLRPDVSEGELQALLRRSVPNIGGYVAVTLLAIAAPYVAAFGYLLIAVLLVVRAPSDPGITRADAGESPASSG